MPFLLSSTVSLIVFYYIDGFLFVNDLFSLEGSSGVETFRPERAGMGFFSSPGRGIIGRSP